MKILITGATGFIGTRLVERLQKSGHSVAVLTRNAATAPKHFSTPVEAHSWDPISGPPPREAFQDIQAVIHLAGETIAQFPWTEERKRRIKQSRVQGTRHLIQGITDLPPEKRPQVFISASAIGYYGDAGDSVLTEDTPAGKGFLADVCVAWENELFHPNLPEVRRLALRTGIVLASEGGMLKQILPLFKMGLGGVVGTGNQWMSWIHREDLVSLYLYCLQQPNFSGPVNAVAPHPATNREFTHELAKAIKRPAFFRMPSPLLKLGMAEASSMLLWSQRAIPKKALDAGFEFKHKTLSSAL